jgi:hypothetical protein
MSTTRSSFPPAAATCSRRRIPGGPRRDRLDVVPAPRGLRQRAAASSLFVTNGMHREQTNVDLLARQSVSETPAERIRIMHDSPVFAQTHLAFRNLGDLKFENVGAAWGLDQKGVAFGSAVGRPGRGRQPGHRLRELPGRRHHPAQRLRLGPQRGDRPARDGIEQVRRGRDGPHRERTWHTDKRRSSSPAGTCRAASPCCTSDWGATRSSGRCSSRGRAAGANRGSRTSASTGGSLSRNPAGNHIPSTTEVFPTPAAVLRCRQGVWPSRSRARGRRR